MKTVDEKIRMKFESLLQEGNNVLRQCGWNGEEYSRFPSGDSYQRFRTQVINLIERVCGLKSSHYESIKVIAESDTSKFNSYYYKDCFGILEGVYKDYSDGFLVEIRNLVRADLLDDFLSQAEALLEKGFYIAAASLAGAVLEDTLRKLCDKNEISLPQKSTINSLNTELAKEEVYDKLIQKEIIAKADIRNNADHGHFDKVREADVIDMVRWVRRFVTECLN